MLRYDSSLLRRLPGIVAIALMTSLLMAPASAQTSAIDWSQVDTTLGALAPTSNLLVAEVQGSTCRTIHGRNSSQPIAIASVFKLYVFGELARQIQLGEASWTDSISLADDLRSMPSGDFAYQPAGTRTTVRALAEAMIWHSDNTATDHLIDYLGRENVQRAFAAFGQDAPTLNAPLLLTRELFGIKMTQSPEWMSRYVAASDGEQLAMLMADIDPLVINPTGGWGNWNGPTAIDGIEWFASADDICRVTASLWALGDQRGLEPVHDILAGNRGGVTDTRAFPLAGFKGGYEAGVVNMTWVLERSDGRVFVVTAGYNTTRGGIDEGSAHAGLVPIFRCLAVTTGQGSCAA